MPLNKDTNLTCDWPYEKYGSDLHLIIYKVKRKDFCTSWLCVILPGTLAVTLKKSVWEPEIELVSMQKK